MSSFLRTVLNSDGMEDWSEDKMKRIINNTLYDTEKAKKICDFEIRLKHKGLLFDTYEYHEASIFKTNKGTYLKYVGDVINSRIAYGKYETLEIIPIKSLKKLLIQINAIDAYISEFGELEEG